MAAKTISRKMMEAYTHQLLMDGEAPKSVYQFVTNNKWKETDFYEHYGSFKDLESKVFSDFFEQAIKLLNADKNFVSYDARNKLISFYYTFFEILIANRSLVFLLLNGGDWSIQNMDKLRPLKRKFQEMIGTLEIDMMAMPQERLERFQDKGMKEAFWGQFLVTLKFWMNDSSPQFEKTDLFIEKSIKASFEVLETRPLEGVMDFGKFLIKETLHK